jgi:hypothetical protein
LREDPKLPGVRVRELPRDLVLLEGEGPRDRRLKRSVAEAIAELSDTAEREVIEAACAATRPWRLAPEPAGHLALADPAADVRGIAIAMQRGVGWPQLIGLAMQFTSEQLAAGAIDEMLIAHAERRRAPAPAIVDASDSEFIEPVPDAALPELLADASSEADGQLIRRHDELAAEVSGLDAANKTTLIARIAPWWPTGPLAESITWRPSGGWSWPWGLAAWLSYASALELAVDDHQWAQLATSGVLFTSQHEWLHDQATEARQRLAAEVLGTDQNARRWMDVLNCCGDHAIDLLLTAAVDAIIREPLTADDESDPATHHARRALLERWSLPGERTLRTTRYARFPSSATHSIANWPAMGTCRQAAPRRAARRAGESGGAPTG